MVTLGAESDEPSCSTMDGVTIHRLRGFNGSVLMNSVGRGRQLVSRYIQDLAPDVIHAHDTYGLMVKGVPIPRVFTIHGFIYGDTLVSGKRFPRLRSRIWRFVETSGWRDQPHIIAISPYVRERLSGIFDGVVHDIDNAVAESFFDVSRNEGKGIIFSAAVISPRKNTLALVEAFARLIRSGVDAELRLAGNVVEPAYGQRLLHAIQAYGLQERVVLLGSISTDQIRAELSRASVFALVSLEENSPMGIEEAMAARVPVVTSNRCGMPYMVRHGESGFLVNPNDPDDIATRLRYVLQNDALRKSMGNKSREIAVDRFHPESVARRTRDVYYEASGRIADADSCPTNVATPAPVSDDSD